ncbi:4-(cytidine 5'-diphospho)-2-C-methyl-D-erythritol kinase [Rubellimicrobium sp. CFH 75288]|uniref:4-(cytidine 5'-diphospho)-2-C-methyl-D-erythritol kinase n=1 Tax=Rubellimicrobium sp. CFH 75288 TaxID=2697034 RepID=UPI001411D83D|nr:4-(cytidine 5'-diphospho)-2-C-methyl-D-erythritol kinase [Rubellimicrobium sp. CFH 75288]NAZ37646.1 4-(cytidine 5'-diphospho)-2-C-methyl-D-erythritol kinase [Rubellimicrobium sp. CFH 75288]
MDRGLAPAKINLALHVLGRRPDGFHDLDSLVAFAELGDLVTATAARTITLSVTGPFAQGVPTDGSNSVLRAAEALARARGVSGRGAAIRLVKTLPHAAGLGSASSDAAAAVRVLAHLWGVDPFGPDDPEAAALGSDVPACLAAPATLRLRGRGERIEVLPPLPRCGLVLVNPGCALPTGSVFAALEPRERTPLPALPALAGAEDLAGWMMSARNDLQAPAEALAPPVAEALALLRRAPGILAACMSGSGATCIGLAADMGAARRAARTIQLARQGWWVAPAPLLSEGAPVPRGVTAQAARVTT